MKYFTFPILVALVMLSIFSCETFDASNAETSVDLRYFDMSTLGVKETHDITPLVVEALDICKNEGYSGLSFPKGTYHFYPTYAPDFYTAITNNDNGLKRTPFPIFNFNNFHIDGGSSLFIFHGKMLPFIIEESGNIKISDLSIDWEFPFFLQGNVIANDSQKGTFDIQIQTPYKVENELLYLTIEREKSQFDKKFGERFAAQLKYDQRVGQNIIWDKSTNAPIYNHNQYSSFGASDFFRATELRKGVVRLKSLYKMLPPIGSVFISKGEYLFNRQSPGFRVFKSKDLTFTNINVHHAGAMGMIAERSMNITLDSFNVVLKDGADRMVTTTADATHFCNCKGLITIKNCTFENMLDDATNIHGTYGRVKKVLSKNEIAYETYHPHQMDYLFAEVGDSVQIVDKNSINAKSDVLIVESVERINERVSVLRFNQSIEGLVEEFDGIDNLSWYPSAIIENNTIKNNRARGFLISTTREVTIRNNYMSSQMSAILMTGDLNLWNESGPNSNLTIENNEFVNNIHSGNKQAILQITPEQDLKEANGETFYSRNIVIRNNIIKTFDAPILKAKSVYGLTFRDNKVIQTKAYKPLYPDEPNLNISNSKGLDIEGNSYKTLSGESIELTIKSVNNQSTNK